MSSFSVVLIIYLFYHFSAKKNDGAAVTANVFANSSTSNRFISLSVLTVTIFFATVFFLSEAFGPHLNRVTPLWLSNIIACALYLILPIALLRNGPPWLAWRVVRHLRSPLLVRIAFWFTPGEKRSDLVGFARLVAASYGCNPVPSALPDAPSGWRQKLRVFFMMRATSAEKTIDHWAVAALALYAEVSGDPLKADRYVRSFDIISRHRQIPRLVRIFAFEALAWQAARRGDWEAVLSRTRLGTGRSMPLLRMLACGHLSGQVNKPLLWLAWLLAPSRITSFSYVQSLVAQPKLKAPVPANQTLQIEHLQLLRNAAEGKPVELTHVLTLAMNWQKQLTAETHAKLLARGLELGVREVHVVTELIPQTLLSELEELAAEARGKLPDEIVANWDEWQQTLAGDIVVRLRNRLFARLETAAEDFLIGPDEPPPPLRECWERWLTMQEATERLGTLMGIDDLSTAWYGGLRLTAWNGACRVYNHYGAESAWVGHIMFSWVVKMAEKTGDQDAAEVNRNNVLQCGIQHDSTLEALQLKTRRAWRGMGRAIGKSLSAAWWKSSFTSVVRKINATVRGQITIILPCGGTLLIVALLFYLRSYEEVFTGLFIGLPLAIGGFALLYLVALRIEKNVRRTRLSRQNALNKVIDAWDEHYFRRSLPAAVQPITSIQFPPVGRCARRGPETRPRTD